MLGSCLRAALLLAFGLLPDAAQAIDYGKHRSLPIDATPLASGGLELRWAPRSDALGYQMTRINPDGSAEPTVDLPAGSDRFTDSTITAGDAFEWRLTATLSDGLTAKGVLVGGVEVELVEARGRVLVCVEAVAAEALAPELARLRQDLAGDGWTPAQIQVAASASPDELKGAILATHREAPLEAVFLLGDLPVPYSGNIAPDSHSNHRGAWPADGYYADLDGGWTDTWRVATGASWERNRNRIGDGKFDPSTPPTEIDLMLGRVDLADLPAFAPLGEIDLLRRYLDKNHAFRHAQTAVPRTALIDDHLGGLQEGVASTARNGFAGIVGREAVGDADWPDDVGAPNHLLGAGLSTANFTTIHGVGSSASFASGGPGVAFSLLFGSYFGDWDNPDNVLRAALASAGPTLASAYSGRPQWQLHGLGLGQPLGEAARLSQNASANAPYYTGYSSRQVHISLLGDPTLRLFPQPPASAASAVRVPGGASLSWSAPAPSQTAELLGYQVDRGAAIGGEFVRLNAGRLTGDTYLDPAPPAAGALYQIRAIYRQTSGSGTFLDSAQAAFAALAPAPPVEVAIGPADACAVEGRTPPVLRATRTGSTTLPLTVPLRYSGSANPLLDIDAPPSVTIAAGQSEASFTLAALPDALAEPVEELLVEADPQGGAGFTATGATSVAIFDDAYSAFAHEWFGDAAHPDAAPDADPDGDGEANLLEFATGRSPLAPDAPALAALGSVERDGAVHRRFTFPHSPSTTPDVELALELSTDLVHWHTPAAPLTPHTSSPHREIWIPDSEFGPRTFVRLTATPSPQGAGAPSPP